MGDSKVPKLNTHKEGERIAVLMQDIQKEHRATRRSASEGAVATNDNGLLSAINFLQAFTGEVEVAIATATPNPYLNMAMFLIRNHIEGKVVTASTLIAAADVPYATGRRKLEEMQSCRFV